MDDVNHYFKDSLALFVPSKYKLSVRTKILDAFSSGLPVITYKANNFDKELFKNNENIICADNSDELILGLRNILVNKDFRSHISKNSFRTYNKKIYVEKTIDQNINLIENNL